MAGLLSTSIAFAALPPYWERAREFAQIAGDQNVQGKMKSNLIESIRYIAPDKYEVIGEKCVVIVQLKTIELPSHRVGPRSFIVEVISTNECY